MPTKSLIQSEKENIQISNQRLSASQIHEEKSGRHYVITIHGINSEGDTFGDFETVLKSHLKQLKPHIEYTTLAFNYPTGFKQDLFYTAYNNLSQFLADNIKNPTVNDSIIFLVHSQGGLVTTIWKARADYGEIKKTSNGINHQSSAPDLDKIYANITDQVITIGTPFWGSNIAKVALDYKAMDNGFDQELKSLVFNSDLILWLRDLAVAVSDRPIKVDKTFYTNIAGVLPNSKSKLFYKREADQNVSNAADSLIIDVLNGFIKRYSFSSEKVNSNKPDRFESDLAVIIPSSRSDFYYAYKKVTCSGIENSKFKITQDEFTIKNLYPESKYILTEALHTNLATTRSKGMASVPLKCVTPLRCDHPVYRYILDAVTDCYTKSCNPIGVENVLTKLNGLKVLENKYDKILTSGIDLQGFSIDFKISVPSDYDMPEKYYEGQPYTQREEITFDENGDEIFTIYQKNTPSGQRNLKSKKILRQIIKINRDLLESELNEISEIKILRRRERNSGLVCLKNQIVCDSGTHDLRLHITGFIKPKSLQVVNRYGKMLADHDNGLVLPIEIQLPSFKNYTPPTVNIFTLIKPGRSTFIKLDMNESMVCLKP